MSTMQNGGSPANNEPPKEEQPMEPDELRRELEQCGRERGEYLAGWKRARADLINYQSEEERRFVEFAKFSEEMVMCDLTVVFGSFESALAALRENGDACRGISLIRDQLEQILKKHGLERIDAPPGSAFDPLRHEAIGEVVSEQPPGNVAEEVEKGYALRGKVIRPARVRIAKGQDFVRDDKIESQSP